MDSKCRAALYMRLPREDGAGESSGIANRRSMLRSWALNRRFTIADEYADDGWSDTSFDRPAFLRMLEDIEAGRIDAVLTKNLYCLGRN